MAIQRLWLGTTNQNAAQSRRTDSEIALTITVNGQDVVDETFPSIAGARRGATEVNESQQTIGAAINAPDLTGDSIRVAVREDPNWQPSQIAVWYESGANPPRMQLLAYRDAQRDAFSISPIPNGISMPIGRYRVGGDNQSLDSVLLLLRTLDRDDAETNDKFGMKITLPGANTDFVKLTTAGAPRQRPGGTNMYWHAADLPFNRAVLNPNNPNQVEMLLTTGASDPWQAETIALFGMGTSAGNVDRAVTLVYLEADAQDQQPKSGLVLPPGGGDALSKATLRPDGNPLQKTYALPLY